MKESEIIQFVQSNIEPLKDGNSLIYRCSTTLIDGLYIPCVVIKSKQARVKQAIKRFDECQKAQPHGIRKLFTRTAPSNSFLDYETIVGTFACGESHIASYDIKTLSESRYAIPPERMAEIVGETSMNWTQFTATMKDGVEFEFGTVYRTLFFNMPEGYNGSDIIKIVSAKLGSRPEREKVFREKPDFCCYVEGI